MKRTIILSALAIVVIAASVIVFVNMKKAPQKSASMNMSGVAGSKQPDSAKKGRKILYWKAPMNPTEIYHHPGKSKMGMDLIPVYEDEESGGSNGTVKIDPVTVQDMGVRMTKVRQINFSRQIRTVAQIDYNEKKLYTVTTKFSGWVDKLYADYTGKIVHRNDPLFSIYSPDLVTTQQEYLLALKTQKMLENSAYPSVRNDGTSLLASTKRRLQYWDVPASEITRLEKTGKVLKSVTMRSPANGIVLHKNIVEGMHLNKGMNALQIADLSTVWVIASVYDYELPWIRIGQQASISLSYLPGRTFEGKISYIYPELEQKSRDVQVRIVLNNPTLELKPGMYANVTIQGNQIPDALVIPNEAVIHTGTRNLVFKALGNGRFKPVQVVLGAQGGQGNNKVQVLSGLKKGDEIVTSSQFLLDSESNLQEAIQKMLNPAPMKMDTTGGKMEMKMKNQTTTDSLQKHKKSMNMDKNQ